MRLMYRNLIDLSIWCFVVYLGTFLPYIEMRVDDFEQQLPREQPPASTVRPEPIDQYMNERVCFHMNRSSCPSKGVCTTLGPGNMSVFCCDMDTNYLKEFLPGILKQNKTHLHVLNATVDELDVSLSMFRRLTSMAFTDGNIGRIIGQFPKHSALACFNISNNNLTSDKLQSTMQRPFAYLYNLSVLDASANNLTKFPLSLVHSNRKIMVGLAGNNYLPCKHFQQVMETTNRTQVNFLQYNKTLCALDLSFNWFKDVSFVNIDLIEIQKMMDERCREINPRGINCTCTPDRLEILEDEVTNLVYVNCAEQQLKEMPTNLPPNTVKLNVSYNNITSLEAVGNDESYKSLRQLIVDYNDIPNILDLEGTKFISNFMIFSIAHNKLKSIHTYVLSNSFETTGPVLFIAGNFIHCDCNTEKTLKPWLLENIKSIPDLKSLECQNGMGPVIKLVESRVCHTPRDWTDYIYYVIGLEVLTLVLLISKVSYDYWVFKTAGYLPWPANKMPRLPCDWLCE